MSNRTSSKIVCQSYSSFINIFFFLLWVLCQGTLNYHTEHESIPKFGKHFSSVMRFNINISVSILDKIRVLNLYFLQDSTKLESK